MDELLLLILFFVVAAIITVMFYTIRTIIEQIGAKNSIALDMKKLEEEFKDNSYRAEKYYNNRYVSIEGRVCYICNSQKTMTIETKDGEEISMLEINPLNRYLANPLIDLIKRKDKNKRFNSIEEVNTTSMPLEVNIIQSELHDDIETLNRYEHGNGSLVKCIIKLDMTFHNKCISIEKIG